jgi:DNA-binding NtrC family response regulator
MVIASRSAGNARRSASVRVTARGSVGREVRSASAASERFGEMALRLRELSAARWGSDRMVEIVGHSPQLAEQLARIEKIAGFREPVVVLGESGVGKESFAQALYLLSRRLNRPFVSVNCPQASEGNLTVSELFGHRKGSFTGAVADHKGYFESADGGTLFLDEIADLPMSAQVMLLRALSTGEFTALGATEPRRFDIRLLAATNRSLNQMVVDEQFRKDLLFRLRYFTLEIPALRERGDDWRLLIEHFLDKLQAQHGAAKRFSDDALRLLAGYHWPGNVRELIGIVTTAYALSDGDIIEPRDFLDRLGEGAVLSSDHLDELFRSLQRRDADFWLLVAEPFLLRDLNRSEVRKLVARGLRDARGSYRRLVALWQLPPGQYQKFMDFLRHHQLKPRAYGEES